VVLAAGGGTRFLGPEHKLRTPVSGRPLVRHAVDGALGAGFAEVIVVTGAVDLTDLLPEGVVIVGHDSWEDGIATSLHVGIRVAAHLGHDAVVVGLGDQVGVEAACWRAVGEAVSSPIVVATFDGERRPPVRLRSDVWSLLPPSGDEGARVLMRRHPELVTEVSCGSGGADIDTVDDLPPPG
jgi:CTP:molybdopterin cytidylyltransferase MocA